MHISRTPFRISFCGGGSDLPSYFMENGGCVVSTTINRYVYITINPAFDENSTVLKYSALENVRDIDNIRHPILRESFRKYGITGVELNSTSDIPSGTGMGSSSSFSVGLFNAIRSYKGLSSTKRGLAEEACDMEINVLKNDIGYQDQYAAAFGGLNFIEFKKGGEVNVEPIRLSAEEKKTLSDNLLLFYTGGRRDAATIIKSYSNNTSSLNDKKQKLTRLAIDLRDSLNSGDIDSMGKYLNQGWEIKKSLSSSVSNPHIEEAYGTAMENGAVGGKLLGAGGNGFLLLYVPKSEQSAVRASMKEYKELPFDFEYEGSKLIYTE